MSFIVTLNPWTTSCFLRLDKTIPMNGAIKPFSPIPGPNRFWGLRGLLGALKNGALSGQLHVYFDEQHKRYGPIYREKIGAMEFVSICDPDDVETLLRHDGKYPRRPELRAWKQYREDNGLQKGLLLQWVLINYCPNMRFIRLYVRSQKAELVRASASRLL